MTQKRKQKKSKKNKKSTQSDLSDNGSIDGSTAPLSYTARGRTHQGSSLGDLESDRALSTSHQSPVIQSTVIQSPVNQSLVSQSLVNQSLGNKSPVSQSPVSQSLVNQSPVNWALVNQAPVNQAPVTSHSHMTFKLLYLVSLSQDIHRSLCLNKLMLLL